MLNSLSGPFPEVRFIPTGGISRQNAAEYLKRPDVLAVGGSWMLPPALLRMGSYREIESLVGEAVSLAATNHPQRLVS
jgi:2-dehydro-3-deoxyphosphogluconate aldolase/(4S)-4-hydroxy-2-oxoglutarate aldolase